LFTVHGDDGKGIRALKEASLDQAVSLHDDQLYGKRPAEKLVKHQQDGLHLDGQIHKR